MQIGFLVVLGIAAAQVAWWMGENVHYSRAVSERLELLYRNSVEAIGAAESGSLATVDNPLTRELISDPESKQRTVAASTIENLRADADSRVRRYLWEGSFFILVLLTGMFVLTASIRHDYAMRRRQQNFLASVSHEFKSPLSSIQLAAETLARRADDEDTRRYVPRILADTERLLITVENLLDTVRLEEGGVELEPRSVAVADIANAVVEELRDRAALHAVTLTCTLDDQAIVNADPQALETILRNLLDNALKACAAGDGHLVEVHSRAHDGNVEISIRDDGMGFPPDHAEMLFEKFFRVGDEMQRATPGTGLGLYIVRKLVERCGGRIAASSAGSGTGATVSVTLPQAAAA